MVDGVPKSDRLVRRFNFQVEIESYGSYLLYGLILTWSAQVDDVCFLEEEKRIGENWIFS